MNTVRAVLPWTLVMTGFGGVVWWLLARDAQAGRWLLAALLIGHGAVHLLFAAPGDRGRDAWPFDMDNSWITTLGADARAVRVAGWGLIAIVVVGFLTSGLSTVDTVVPAGWWPAAVVGSSIASIVALVVFFNPQFVLGLAIDVALVWLAGFGPWAP